MGTPRPVRRVLPPAVGIGAVVAIFAVLTMSGGGPVDVVCNIGTSLDQGTYERCLAELPALQAKHDEAVRNGVMARPLVAITGGIIVALIAHLLTRSRAPKHPPID